MAKKMALTTGGHRIEDHFADVSKMVVRAISSPMIPSFSMPI